jgi:hypothetical protein
MKIHLPDRHDFKIARIIFLSFSLLVVALPADSQALEKIDLGVGMGLDYGGFGTRLTYTPIEQVGVFGSLGYNLNSLGYNLGAQFRIPVKKRFMGYLTAMYGYNAVLKVEGLVKDSGYTYYGASVGAGVQWKLSAKKNLWLNLEGILPFRPQEFSDAIRDLKTIGYEIEEPADVGFSLGLHYRFKEKTME